MKRADPVKVIQRIERLGLQAGDLTDKLIKMETEIRELECVVAHLLCNKENDK